MKKAVVTVSVADLRREPIPLKLSRESDPLQESQLLFGEQVKILEINGEWTKVEAIEQPKFLNGAWQGYPGWVKSNALAPLDADYLPNLIVHDLWAPLHLGSEELNLSYGTRLAGKSDGEWVQIEFPKPAKIHAKHVRFLENRPFNRKELLDHGKRFLGFPYFWGGRSAFNAKLRTSIDCSGLVNLLYSVQAVNIPRDAHDQFLKSHPISPQKMEAGDLIFMAPVNKPERMTHVMIFAGNGRILEATGASKNVRETTIELRLGKSATDQGQSNGEYFFYFRRVL